MQAPKTELCGLIRITDTLKKQVQHLISHHIRPNTPEAETYNSSIINRKQLLLTFYLLSLFITTSRNQKKCSCWKTNVSRHILIFINTSFRFCPNLKLWVTWFEIVTGDMPTEERTVHAHAGTYLSLQNCILLLSFSCLQKYLKREATASVHHSNGTITLAVSWNITPFTSTENNVTCLRPEYTLIHHCSFSCLQTSTSG